jgi:hypothetical protein
MKIASDWISISTTALIAILIASLFYLSAKHTNELEKQSRTYYSVVWASDIFYKIDQAASELTDLNTHNADASGRMPFQDLHYVSSDKAIESRVFIILNQYNALGSALRENLIDLEKIKGLRKHTIEQTRVLFEVYLAQYRDQINAVAWCDFEYLYTQVTNNAIFSPPKSCNIKD